MYGLATPFFISCVEEDGVYHWLDLLGVTNAFELTSIEAYCRSYFIGVFLPFIDFAGLRGRPVKNESKLSISCYFLETFLAYGTKFFSKNL